MTITWKDPNIRLHGKRHKRDRYYFRWHYGKQRVVQVVAEYVDKPTERQKSAREAFTELRREVARQLRDAELRNAWMRRFEEDNEGYKMLHTYVYAKMKAPSDSVRLDQHKKGESCVVEATETTEATRTSMRRGNALVSTSRTKQKFRSAEVQRFRRGCVVAEGDAINGVSTPRRRAGYFLFAEGDAQKGVSTSHYWVERRNTITSLLVVDGGITPLFLPSQVPKTKHMHIKQTRDAIASLACCVA